MDTAVTIVMSGGTIVVLSLLLAVAWPSFISLWNDLGQQYGPRSAIAWAALLLSPPVPFFGLLLATCFLRARRGADEQVGGFVDWWFEGDGQQRHSPLSWTESCFAANLVLLLVCGAVLLTQSLSGWWVVSRASVVSMIAVPWVVAGVLSGRLIWQAVGRYG